MRLDVSWRYREKRNLCLKLSHVSVQHTNFANSTNRVFHVCVFVSNFCTIVLFVYKMCIDFVYKIDIELIPMNAVG